MYTDIQCSATIYSKLYCNIFIVDIALLQVITMKKSKYCYSVFGITKRDVIYPSSLLYVVEGLISSAVTVYVKV
jgi:hypothetical protein